MEKGITGKKTFFDLDTQGLRFVFDLNILTAFLTTQVFAKDMVDNGGGNIINISSMNAFRPLTKIPAYSAAKAGVSNFTQWLAVHFAPCNIRVNAIAPGFFVTNQNKNLLFTGRAAENQKDLVAHAFKPLRGLRIWRARFCGFVATLQAVLLPLSFLTRLCGIQRVWKTVSQSLYPAGKGFKYFAPQK